MHETSARVALEEARDRAKAEILALPRELRALDGRGSTRTRIVSDGLVREIERLVAEAR